MAGGGLKMAYKVYSYGDVGAPAVLLPASGGMASRTEMIQILDACLVNGYGSKAAAGWTKPFTSDASNDLYLSASSSGYAVRVGEDTTAQRGLPFQPVMNPDSLTTSGNEPVKVSLSNNTAVGGGAWTIFADDKSFIIWVRQVNLISSSYAGGKFYYFGEITPKNAGEIICMSMGSNNPTTTPNALSGPFDSTNWGGLNGSSGVYKFILTGDVSTTDGAIKAGGPFSSSYSSNIQAIGKQGFNSTIESKIIMSPFYVILNTSKLLLGSLKNVWCPEILAYNNFFRDDTFTVGDRKFYVMQYDVIASTTNPSGHSILFIEVE